MTFTYGRWGWTWFAGDTVSISIQVIRIQIRPTFYFKEPLHLCLIDKLLTVNK